MTRYREMMTTWPSIMNWIGGELPVKRFSVLVLIVLLASAGPSGSQSNANLEEDLRHSQMCAKAAREFRNQPEWKDAAAGPFTFTSHFNKNLGKCLVKVTSTTGDPPALPGRQ